MAQAKWNDITTKSLCSALSNQVKRFWCCFHYHNPVYNPNFQVDTWRNEKAVIQICMSYVNMFKCYFFREKAPQPPPAGPVVSMWATPAQYHSIIMGEQKNVARCQSRTWEIKKHWVICSLLAHLSNSAYADIHLIEDNLLHFSDYPHQTSVLCHDVEGHKPIKQHAYRINPNKRAVMQQEVSYFNEHGLSIPSTSAWSSPCVSPEIWQHSLFLQWLQKSQFHYKTWFVSAP